MIRGPGIWAVVLDGQRGRDGTQQICECVCAYESRKCCVCAFISELQSLPAEGEEGDLVSVIMFYVSPVWRYC